MQTLNQLTPDIQVLARGLLLLFLQACTVLLVHLLSSLLWTSMRGLKLLFHQT